MRRDIDDIQEENIEISEADYELREEDKEVESLFLENIDSDEAVEDADEETESKAADVCYKVYELAQAGKKKEAMELVYLAVDRFIRSEVNHTIIKGITPAIDTEDMYQDIYKEIMEHIQNYDPTKRLTTFVKNYVVQARCEYFSRATNIPLYYVQHLNKLRRVEKAYEERGLKPPSLLDYYLETKLPVTTIVNCLAYGKGAETVSLESQSVERSTERLVDTTVSEFRDSPEKIFMGNERKKSLLSVLANLPYEQRIMIGFKFPYMMEVVEPNFFNDHPEMKEVFEDINTLSDKNNTEKKVSNKIIADFLGIPVEQVDRMNIISILEENEDLQGIAGRKKRRRKEKEVATIPVELAIKAIEELEISDFEEQEGLYRV